jgi:hypothetical protein
MSHKVSYSILVVRSLLDSAGAGSQRFIADHYEASPGPVSALPPLPPEFLLSGPVIIKGKEVFDA